MSCRLIALPQPSWIWFMMRFGRPLPSSGNRIPAPANKGQETKMRLAALFTAAALIALALPAGAADLDKPIQAPALDPANSAGSETAVLAGGCFWGQQGLFQHVKGVTKVVAGYSGGLKSTATYDQVTTE